MKSGWDLEQYARKQYIYVPNIYIYIYLYISYRALWSTSGKIVKKYWYVNNLAYIGLNGASKYPENKYQTILYILDNWENLP